MTALLPDGPVDTLGVLDWVLDTPAQVTAAADCTTEGAGCDLVVPDLRNYADVVVVTDAESAPAADAAVALVRAGATLPLQVVTDRELPGHLGPRSLVIAASCGRADAGIAHDLAERRATVVGLGRGALLDALAARDVPVCPVAEDAPAARFALPELLVTLLGVFDHLGWVDDLGAQVTATVDQLERRRATLVADPSPADRLARRLRPTLTLAYGAGPIGASAANRWKGQINENAKVAAFAAALPDLAVHELEGWGQHGDITRQVFSLVTLRHDHEHPADAARFADVEAFVEEVVHARHEVRAEGDGPLAQLLDLWFQADVVSCHLARAHEIDPGPSGVG